MCLTNIWLVLALLVAVQGLSEGWFPVGVFVQQLA